MRASLFLPVVVAALSGLIADEAAGDARQAFAAGRPGLGGWTEVKWPFALDQWGSGRAFECTAADCGAAITLYLRPKLGFCNCSTGVSDDAELDRVGDLELLGGRVKGLRDGRSVTVGWMQGRSRPYHVALSYATPRAALAIAFNDKCDVVVATVVTERGRMTEAERATLDFLNTDHVLRWIERELGI